MQMKAIRSNLHQKQHHQQRLDLGFEFHTLRHPPRRKNIFQCFIKPFFLFDFKIYISISPLNPVNFTFEMRESGQ